MAERYEVELTGSRLTLRGLSLDEVHAMIANRVLQPADRIRVEGGEIWKQVAELRDAAPGEPRIVRGNELLVAPTGGARLRRRAGQIGIDTELELTPMIDVVFQLLIFFMLTGYFAIAPRAELPRAEAGVGVVLEGKLLVDLTPDPDSPDQTQVWVAERDTPLNLSQFLTEAQAIVSSAGTQEALIRADRDVPVGHVRKVMEALHGLGVTSTVIGVQEKR